MQNQKSEMIKALRQDGALIVREAIRACLPDEAVVRALKDLPMGSGRLILVAIGKAAWRMAQAAQLHLGTRISEGIVITKYGHSEGPIGNLTIREAGHPVLDMNSVEATEQALELVENLNKEDTVLFLISGGGSALFEKPLIELAELEDVNKQLLASGADIVEINTIRKRLSAVKGGKFALSCQPAKVFSIILSDVLGDPVDMIASGPAAPDESTSEDALQITKKYGIQLTERAMKLLSEETPKELVNVSTRITGSVTELASAAAATCERLGYEPHIITSLMACQAKEAGQLIGSVAASHAQSSADLAFLFGGETVVKLTGKGKGGRNQELALAAAQMIAGTSNQLVMSFGSDGTDGPTDAAGGLVTGDSLEKLKKAGYLPQEVLQENNSYEALKAIDGLIMTGPTGTNVNDLAVVLVRKQL